MQRHSFSIADEGEYVHGAVDWSWVSERVGDHIAWSFGLLDQRVVDKWVRSYGSCF